MRKKLLNFLFLCGNVLNSMQEPQNRGKIECDLGANKKIVVSYTNCSIAPHQVIKEGAVLDIAFSSDDLLLATASCNETAKVWDIKDGKCLQEFSHDANVQSVAFSSDNRQLVTTSSGTVRIWDVIVGNCLKVLCHNKVSLAQFSNDGLHIVTASHCDGKIWNAAGECLKAFNHGNIGNIKKISFYLENNLIAIITTKNFIELNEKEVGEECKHVYNSPRVWSRMLSNDKKHILIGEGHNCRASLWEIKEGPIAWFDHDSIVTLAKFSNTNASFGF